MDSQYMPRRSEHSEVVHPRRRPRRTIIDHFGIVALLLLLGASVVLILQLRATQMLTDVWLYVAVGFLAVINVIHLIVQLPLRRNKLGKLLCGILALPMAGVMLYASIATGSVQNTISKISGKVTEKDMTYVIVLFDDPAQTLNDAADYTFGYLESTEVDAIGNLEDQIKDEIGYRITTQAYANASDLAEALYDGEVGAILLNQGHISVLEKTEGYDTFSSKTRIIHEIATERQMKNQTAEKLDIDRPFVIFCSGIDARDSDISAKSLSDVNILAVVNPKTHQILLINTPRDYYLPLTFNGEMDKLTHASLYGIDESMRVLSNLYSLDVSYYVRVNFYGLVNIVDALGGVDVYSDYAFTTNTMEIPNENGDGFYQDYYTFDEGTNHLDGRAALAFSRERYSFEDGDIQRGKNQMAVIKAIVKKATSPSVLSNYQELFSAVSDAFITNLSYDDIASLVQMQQKDMQSWNISSFSVYGDGDIDETYSGGYAYVMYPDAELIDEAKTMILQVVNPK